MQLFKIMQAMADITGIAMKPEQYGPFIRPVNKPAVKAGAVLCGKKDFFIGV